MRSVMMPPPKTTTVIVAGTFDAAGALPCQGICQFNIILKQWTQLGQGIKGEVSSIVYASNPEALVAVGSMVLSDSTPANVAMYSFSNSTWSAVGQGSQIPGPMTAHCEIDNGNASSIFAAGSSSDGSLPFLTFWNGVMENPWNHIPRCNDCLPIIYGIQMRHTLAMPPLVGPATNCVGPMPFPLLNSK